MPQGLLSASLLLATALLQGDLQAQPADPVSRAEAVVSLVNARVQDLPVIPNKGQFADIPRGIWFEYQMLYAERVGIIHAAGEPPALRPYDGVTRAEMLRLLTATFNLPVGYPYQFTDVASSDWFEPYAGLAEHYHLFPLQNAYTLDPQRFVSREEAGKIMRLFDRVRSEGAPSIQQNAANGRLKVYTVASTRRQKVKLVDPASSSNTAMVRRIRIPPSLPELRTLILRMVNEERAKEGLLPLTYSTQLQGSAQAYAERMTEEGFFGHVAPDGQTLKDRVIRTGYYDRSFSQDCYCVKGYALGENLARGQKTAREAMDDWMNSPSHRAAILNPDYTVIGIGVKAGVWVQHFGGILLPGQTVHSKVD